MAAAETPSWYLTVAEIKQFYASIGYSGELADQAVERLTGPAAAEYSWTAYLTRDNAAGGIEEAIDGDHYCFFDVLVTRMLEEQGLISRDQADIARQELMAAARDFASAIARLRNARRVLKR